MKWKIVFILSTLLALGVIALASWLWSLPADSPTLAADYRRGSFFMSMALGSMGLLQGVALLGPREGWSRRVAGVFAVLFGGFSIFVALRMVHLLPFAGS